MQSKLGQKRPVTSPAPPLPSTHHHLHHSSSTHSNHIGNVLPNNTNQNSSSGSRSFAAALRNLAKQADVKDEENPSGSDGKNTNSSGGVINSGGNIVNPINSGNGSSINMHRISNSIDNDGRNNSSTIIESRGRSSDNRNEMKKRNSPQPPEKVCSINILIKKIYSKKIYVVTDAKIESSSICSNAE